MPLVDGISRKGLEAVVITAMIDAKTLAGNRVFTPRPWPTRADLFPMIIVQAPNDRKVGLSKGTLQFNATIRLIIVARIVGSTAEQVQLDLDQISGQIEEAIFTTNAVVNNVQQFTTVETQTAINADGRDFIGEAGMAFDCEVYQVFGPIGVPLTGVDMTINNAPDGTQLAQAKVTFSNA